MPSGVSAKASNDFPSRCMWGFTVSREISRSTTVFVVKVFTSFGGMINGPVHCTETLELQPSARVRGDVHYKSLEIHHGAVVEGKLVHHEESEIKAIGLKLAS